MANSKIEDLRKELATKPIQEKALTTRGTILALMPEILSHREKGVTYAQLVTWFSENGVETTITALSKYVRQHTKKLDVSPPLQEKPVFKNLIRKDPAGPTGSGKEFLAIHNDL